MGQLAQPQLQVDFPCFRSFRSRRRMAATIPSSASDTTMVPAFRRMAWIMCAPPG